MFLLGALKVPRILMGNRQSLTNDAASLKENESFMERHKGRVANSRNAILVQKCWYETANRRNFRALRRFCSKDAIIRFQENKTGSSLYSLLDELEKSCISFPDYCLWFDEIKEVDKGIIKVTNNCGRGTHTGPPYSFGTLPPIPTSGLSVEEDACDLTIHILHGKIMQLVIDVKDGRLVGPPGLYMKGGGRISEDADLN